MLELCHDIVPRDVLHFYLDICVTNMALMFKGRFCNSGTYEVS